MILISLFPIVKLMLHDFINHIPHHHPRNSAYNRIGHSNCCFLGNMCYFVASIICCFLSHSPESHIAHCIMWDCSIMCSGVYRAICFCLCLFASSFLDHAEQGLGQWEETLHMQCLLSMREDIAYVMPSLIGWDLAKSCTEIVTRDELFIPYSDTCVIELVHYLF